MNQNKKIYKTEREGQIERVITASKKDYTIIDRCVGQNTTHPRVCGILTESIDYLFSKNWFYDFVKKEKILCTAESK